MYNKKTCKQTYFRIPKGSGEAFHLSWIHQPHRQTPDHHRGSDSATAPRKPALIPKLHSLLTAASWAHGPQLSQDDAGGCHRQGWPGNSRNFKQLLESWRDASCLKPCQRAKHQSLQSVSNATPQPPWQFHASGKGERPREANELLTEKNQQAQTAPAPTCQVATPVAVGGALNPFQSTCLCPSWNSSCLLWITQTCRSCKKCN